MSLQAELPSMTIQTHLPAVCWPQDTAAELRGGAQRKMRRAVFLSLLGNLLVAVHANILVPAGAAPASPPILWMYVCGVLLAHCFSPPLSQVVVLGWVPRRLRVWLARNWAREWNTLETQFAAES